MNPIQWLDQFFAACIGCRVDFIATHVSQILIFGAIRTRLTAAKQYDCVVNNVYGTIVNNFAKYNKPIWVTEFSCYGATVAADVTFANGVLPLFDADAKIFRFQNIGVLF